MTPGPDPRTLTLDDALTWVAEIFEEPTSKVLADTRRADLPAWDSLGQLVLMSALDQQFAIRLRQEDLASLTSVQSILDILARHGRLTG